MSGNTSFARSKIRIVKNGVETDAFRPAPPDLSLRDGLGIPRDAVLILFTNPRLATFPSNEMALRMLFRAIPDVERLIPERQVPHPRRGAGDRRALLPDVIYSGYVNDLPAYLNLADICIAPYPPEAVCGGTRDKVCEYLACGKPIVATREAMRGFDDALPGEHFLLAEDEPDFAEKLMDCVRRPDTAERIGRNARATLRALRLEPPGRSASGGVSGGRGPNRVRNARLRGGSHDPGYLRRRMHAGSSGLSSESAGQSDGANPPPDGVRSHCRRQRLDGSTKPGRGLVPGHRRTCDTFRSPSRALAGAELWAGNKARGRYVAYLDDDAVASPRWLERIRRSVRDHSAATDRRGRPILPIWEAEKPAWLRDDSSRTWASSIGRLLPCPLMKTASTWPDPMSAMKRTVLEESGGFPTEPGPERAPPAIQRRALDAALSVEPGEGPLVRSGDPRPSSHQGRAPDPGLVLDRFFWQGVSDALLEDRLARKGVPKRFRPRRMWRRPVRDGRGFRAGSWPPFSPGTGKSSPAAGSRSGWAGSLQGLCLAFPGFGNAGAYPLQEASAALLDGSRNA